ncbi:MAG: hypothetical protein ACP5R4_14065 [Armatimonadota bacterium]
MASNEVSTFHFAAQVRQIEERLLRYLEGLPLEEPPNEIDCTTSEPPVAVHGVEPVQALLALVC